MTENPDRRARPTSVETQLESDLRYGLVDASVSTSGLLSPKLLANHNDELVLESLKKEMQQSQRFYFSVAFVTQNALSMLKQSFIDYGGTGTIVTSDYQNFNHPRVFRDLLKLKKVETRIFTGGNFHPKGYLFEQEQLISALIGSSNLTEQALSVNHEWNLFIKAARSGALPRQFQELIEYQLDQSEPLTEEWIEHYEHIFTAPEYQAARKLFLEPEPPLPAVLIPNAMQERALRALTELRDTGQTKALIVSSTGTGKTILSAMDIAAFGPRRLLYIVHREQILDKAISEFKRVLSRPESEYGKLTGSTKNYDAQLLFATVQTLSQPGVLERFNPRDFDYVLIDEVHRSGAETYQRIINHFEPQFFLGMTATPERSDGVNIFEYFDYNVPFEIRLSEALQESMLAPFHYYGVTDYIDENQETIDETADLAKLVIPERVNYLVEQIELYRQEGKRTHGLIFVSRNDEASELSAALNERSFKNGHRIRTVAISGATSLPERELQIQRLERNEIDYLITVDILNEGIDIPVVNQVIMLRQTQSSIVFIQQLGRGLRKHPDKESLIVIDFIGNYKNNYLIPIALFGDTSLNKDSIRKKLVGISQNGVIAGVSSINFDKISQERILKSIENTNLVTWRNLREAYLDLKYRLNRVPMLQDFLEQGSVDPVVIAGFGGSYYDFVVRAEAGSFAPQASERAKKLLRYVSAELLGGQRPQELLLLRELLNSQTLSKEAYKNLLYSHDLVHDEPMLSAVESVLNLSYFTNRDQNKYGPEAPVRLIGDEYTLDEALYLEVTQQQEVRGFLNDLVHTGLRIAQERYGFSDQFQIGKKYSRRHASWLLNFASEQSSTIYGYRADEATKTCPIFVTYHKDEYVAESVNYRDEFVNEGILHWFTRTRRSFESAEVQRILSGEYQLHLFVKKDDGEGDDFYYLGEVTTSDAFEDKQGSERLPVVRMNLHLETPVEHGLYQYLIDG